MQHKGEGNLKPSNFQLIDKPRVSKSIFQLNKDFDFTGEVSLEISKDINIIKGHDKEMCSLVILNLKFFETSDLKDVPFKLKMEIEGMFGWDDELEENPSQLEILLKQNAPAILYSYLRPIITSISIEANLPPLVIPLMNFRE